MKTLGPRERAGDYLAELQSRFGDQPQLIEINRGWRLNPAACMSGYSDEERKPYKIESGIAIIDISGVLSNDPWWFDETGYADIQNEATLAADDEEVNGILLRMNTPGGSTENAFETAAVLAEVGKKKPMWAVADTIAYSAGYLLASQASKIYVPQTSGGVGSIGVYMMHMDYSEALAKIGIKPTLISAGEGKASGNPYQPLSKEAFAAFKADVDRMYGEFTGAVSCGRGMTEAQVIALGAWTYPGAQRSMQVGLSDVAGSMSDAHRDFVAHLNKKLTLSMSASAAMQSPKEVSQKMETQETTAEATPAPVVAAVEQPVVEAAAPVAEPVAVAPVAEVAPVDAQALIASARKEGRETHAAEMTEINDLCAIAGKPELFGEFFSKKLTVADVRKALLDDRAAKDEEVTTNSQVAALPGGALANLNSRAAAIAAEKGLTKEQAFAAALAENPQAYDEYEQQQQAAIKAARA